MVTPRTSTSWVVTRTMLMMGVTQRTLSSMARSRSSGERRAMAIWSGRRIIASKPPAITLRVVSFPPTNNSKALPMT